MATAKDLIVKPISQKDAAVLVKRIHYSGKVTQNSQLHLGVFLNGRLEGAMQFGPSIDKRKMQGLVSGTGWNGFTELNRMAFSEALPRNSESRALSIAFMLIRKHYPQIEWVVSFADGTQCGDGTIYRASGFVLTACKKNTSLLLMPGGEIVCDKTLNDAKYRGPRGEMGSSIAKAAGAKALSGFQLRYIYFLNPAARGRLTVPILPFSRIEEIGAGMYKGKKIMRTKEQDAGYHPALGGATPTCTLHIEDVK